jgi:uncharacterized protein YceK
MKKLLLVLSVVALSGCSTIMEYIPSRWDDNQSKAIVTIQQSARHLECTTDSVTKLQMDIEWFDIYSSTKPTRDVNKLTPTLTTTVKELNDRVKAGPVSPMYCDLKKKLIVQQADIIAAAVMGRF